MTITPRNEKDNEVPHATDAGEGPETIDPGDFDAGHRLEALFELLRRPAGAVEAHRDDLAAGTRLGEFTILRALASGGMGRVYLARQESLNRMVALKVCRYDLAADPRMKSRFLAEGLALAQLSHLNVVPVLSTGEEGGYLYLAMEYVTGPTLEQVLQAIRDSSADSLASAVVARVLADRNESRPSEVCGNGNAKLDRAYQTWIVQTLQQVAEGLAAAHAAGVVHRDIKPANIVFAANGVPKIVDFGLARSTQGPSTTVTGEFYGTPSYTSPEQARGETVAVSPASDVFSFGVLLFECLTLHRPFRGRSSVDVLNAILNSDPPLLRSLAKKLPWELEAITDKCLRKTPTERYNSGQTLAEDLRSYLELRPISARATGPIRRFTRMVRRRPWAASFLIVLACAAIMGGFLARNAWGAYKAQKAKDFAKSVDDGDIALFRCLTGQRPTWLPKVAEQYRQQGISAYTAALRDDPNAIRPIVQRARLYAGNKDSWELALGDLDKAQQLQPRFQSIRKFRAHILQKLGREKEAQACLEAAKKLNPTAPDDLYWLGVIAYSADKDAFASYDYFSRDLSISPEDYWSRLERAYSGRVESEGDATEKRVIPELEIAKTMRPELPFASEMLVQWYAFDPSRQRKELSEQIERFGLNLLRAHTMADLLQKGKRFDEAERMLMKVLEQDRGGVTAENLGDLEYRRCHYDRARDWYQRAIREGKSGQLVYWHLANAFTALRDWEGAEKAYVDGIAKHRQDAFLYRNLGSWYLSRGRISDAERIERQGCELPAEVAEVADPGLLPSGQVTEIALCYENLADLLGRSGRQNESAHVLERGIKELEQKSSHSVESLDSAVDRLKELLGERYIYDGKREKALALVNAESKRKPLTIFQTQMLMSLCNQLGMPETAMDIGRVAELTFAGNPSMPHPVSARQNARMLVDAQLQTVGRYGELFDRLEARRALGEEFSTTDYGCYIFYEGPQALMMLEEGTKKYPDSVLLQSKYMQLLAKAGRKAEAWKAYERSRDLYFSQVDANQVPALPVVGDAIQGAPMAPVLEALSWYTYLLQDGKDVEFNRLDERLRAVCPKMATEAKRLLLPRASAEFAAGRYAAATKSLEICLHDMLGNEAVLTGMLARSLRALNRRDEAIKCYRRAVQLSDGSDPTLLSEFLCLIAQEQGAGGVLRELPAYNQVWLRLNVRPNATLASFAAWAAIAKGDDRKAFEKLVLAGPFFLQATRQPDFAGDEAVACATLLQIVSERLGDSNRLAAANKFMKGLPAERVKAMQQIFALPARRSLKAG
jgi:serine/threonine protein kinase/predicted Zn-dependent protease